MAATGYRVGCKCGGHVQVLPEDGVYYVLTDKGTIVFQGYCIKCKEPVVVEQDIFSLRLECPDKSGSRYH